VGPKGTLVLPTWNYDFPKGSPFDIRHTPSQVGALTEAGRHHPGAVRTGHPVHPFVAIGHDASAFRGIVNYSAYGEESPFSLLRRAGAQIAVLDVSEDDSMTFYHHVEEVLEVKYRFHKKISGSYTDFAGKEGIRDFDLFARYIEKDFEVSVNLDPMGEIAWQNGLYLGDRPKVGSGFRVVEATNLFRLTAEVISRGEAEGALYELKGHRPSFLN
jgi:aminoglycoside 3-N-acetyltransferase